MARRILSFDIGMRNLAFAELGIGQDEASPDAVRLRRWGLINLNPAGKKTVSPDEVITALVTALDRAFVADDPSARYDYVLVENQPSRKNPSMKSIQVALHAYFATLRLYSASVDHVRLVGATQKLLCARGCVGCVRGVGGVGGVGPVRAKDPPIPPEGEEEESAEGESSGGGGGSSSDYKKRKNMSIEIAKLYVPALASAVPVRQPKQPKAPKKSKAPTHSEESAPAQADASAPEAAAEGADAATTVAVDAAAAATPLPGLQLLCDGEDLEGVLGVYRAAKKRDDLCDALCQAVAFLENLSSRGRGRGGPAGPLPRRPRAKA